MDENTSPILVWILILVVAAVIGVAAITTEIHHNESLAAATSTNAGATTTDATSSLNANIAAAVSNPTPSASAPEPSPYRYSPIPTEATSAVSASIGQSAARPDFAPCTANDLTGSAGWQGAGGTLTGAIKLENSSDSACSLPHAVRLAMMSSSETLPVDQTGPTDQGNYTDLYPGYQAYLWFSWSNWCRSTTGYPAYVMMTLPSGGYLKVPLIDAQGRPQSDVPRCDDPTRTSAVRAWF